jgi:hypothetical protein
LLLIGGNGTVADSIKRPSPRDFRNSMTHPEAADSL